MGKDLYIEVGGEEIPAGYIVPAAEAMAAQMVRFLDDQRIAHGKPFTTGTPRRLVLLVPDVAPHQEACTTEIVGPPRQAAFNAEGRPTKAAEGFARSQSVAVEDLKIKDTPKGRYLCVVRKESGLPAKDVLEKMLPDFIARIPFPKSMRWAAQSVTFARPLHWIVALLGEEILNFHYGEVQSGAKSFGHRFMSPEWIPVADYASHKENLKKHFVMVDREERKRAILEGIRETARQVGGRILEDEDLLDEVANLVEHPMPLLGEYEEKYLKLPPELLITVMKEHQRYFAVVDADGKLLRYFVTVSNTIPKDPAVVAAGNARVIRARLEDARFYYEEDQKIRLEDRVKELRNVVFHSKLGTSWEKTERFTELARWLGTATQMAPDSLKALLRAAFLCKADLLSGMVGEFPELQGAMGRAYARLQGEPEEVAEAIYEHYLPVRAGGAVPSSMAGALLSIADKMDTIAGCFGVGLIPSGTADPFALRRQTLGIIRIILEKSLRIPLSALIGQALPLLASRLTEPPETVMKGLLDFFQARLHHFLVSRYGYTPDTVDASLAVGIDDPVASVARAKALASFRSRPDFESLAIAVKRVANIIKEPETAPIDMKLFRNETEKALSLAILEVDDAVAASLGAEDYDSALASMAKLKEPIDAFFESVLVMDKDDAIRRNRLALLTHIHGLFSRVADFRKLQTTV